MDRGTSFLQSINSKRICVAIVGKSGIGKTTFIRHLLVHHSQYFELPLCYTSRKIRTKENEYKKLDKREILELWNNDRLLNLDEVHDDVYAIDKASFCSIIDTGKIAIKDIHPKNISKLQRSISMISGDIFLVTVQLKRTNKLGEDQPFVHRDRKTEDDYWNEYRDFGDIHLSVLDHSIDQMVDSLISKLDEWFSTTRITKSPEFIDQQNRAGYNELAPEFIDSLRITTSNFHSSSLAYWHLKKLEIKERTGTQAKILEIGSGNGWLFKEDYISWPNLHSIDIAEEMLQYPIDKKYVGSVRALPFKSSSFDYVVSSLGDPYCYGEAFVEIGRILKSGGRMFLTIPGLEWKLGFRTSSNKNRTTFLKNDKKKINTFSLDLENEMIRIAMEIAGLRIIEKRSMLLETDTDISDDVLTVLQQGNIKLGDLSLVDSFDLEKK